jgi:hypothetical protein
MEEAVAVQQAVQLKLVLQAAQAVVQQTMLL